MSDDETSPPPQQDEDITIPRAAMNKMIKELCPNVRVANEAREVILSCCTEFIHLLSSEANDVCNVQQKKTINAEHVLMALDSLGFGDFRKDCEEVLNECKDVAAKRRRQSTRLENLGIPEEELLRQQQELFARARAEAAEQEMQLAAQIAAQQAAAAAAVVAPSAEVPTTSQAAVVTAPIVTPATTETDDEEDYS